MLKIQIKDKAKGVLSVRKKQSQIRHLSPKKEIATSLLHTDIKANPKVLHSQKSRQVSYSQNRYHIQESQY